MTTTPRMPSARPTLLILAASRYQVPFIEAAHMGGCRVLTVDNRPDNPGHALADASFNCDTTDVDGLVTLARQQAIDGVLAAATDVALDAAAAIAQTLNLPGPSIACVNVLTRKLAFRTFQERLELPHPDYANSVDEVGFPPPWIVKPNRGSGSKGVCMVERREALAAARHMAAAQSIDGSALIEAFTQGPQGTIEGVLHDGHIAANLVTDRLTAAPPYVATRGHRVPTTLPVSAESGVLAQVRRVFGELGYRDGPFDADFVVRNDGTPMLIELTPRAGGNSLVRLLQASTGFDMPSYAVNAALGREVPPPPFQPRPAAVEIFGVHHDGRLNYKLEQVNQLAAADGIQYLRMDLPPGALAHAFIDGRYRVGELVASAATADALADVLQDARQRIQLGVR